MKYEIDELQFVTSPIKTEYMIELYNRHLKEAVLINAEFNNENRVWTLTTKRELKDIPMAGLYFKKIGDDV